MGRAPVGVERELRQLRAGGAGHLLAIGVAELSTEEAREGVDIAPPPGVEHVGPLAALEHEQVTLARERPAVAREMEQRVLACGALKLLVAHTHRRITAPVCRAEGLLTTAFLWSIGHAGATRCRIEAGFQRATPWPAAARAPAPASSSAQTSSAGRRPCRRRPAGARTGSPARCRSSPRAAARAPALARCPRRASRWRVPCRAARAC